MSGTTDIVNIYLVRHGECDLNRRYIGSGTDISLLEKGQEEIRTLTQKLLADGLQGSIYIYSSILKRAEESCNIFCDITGYNNVTIDERLNEIDFGVFENLTYEEIMLSHSKVATMWYDDVYSITPDGGEPFTEFVNRVKSFWDELIVKRPKNSTIILFTHGGVIQLLRCFYHNDSINNRWNYNLKRGEYIKLSLL